MIVRPRLLPATMAAMVLLFGAKAVDLALAIELPAASRIGSAAAATRSGPVSAQPAEPNCAVANVAPANSALDAPPVSDAERAVLLELRARHAQLDARESEVEARERLVEASEHRLGTRLDELTALQGRLQALEETRRQHDEANWAGLVKLYEAMKPRDAAAIFNDLDMAVLLPVVDRMKENKAAAILAAMDPAKARTLTAELAQSRLRANRLPAAKGT